jgi:outer membrane protein TolC
MGIGNTAVARSAALLLSCLLASCADEVLIPQTPRPSVASSRQPTASLKVDASQIQPMYDRRMLAIDLPAVVRIAMARNIDIQEAQQRVAASHGELDANVGMIFPSISPNITGIGLAGVLSTPTGLAVQSFNHVFPIAAVLQWVINPGQVAYDIIASKRRLEASEQQDQAVVLETTRVAAIQYYDVVLAQAQVAAARQAVKDAEELLRIDRLQFKTGTGLQVDVLRAEAALALKQQNVLTALNGFYNASVSLTVTLDLDPTVMLVPKTGSMRAMALVREDLSIDDMLVDAVRFRPDLEAVRSLFAAADADAGATIWGGLGPQVTAARTFGMRPPARSLTDTFYTDPRYIATGGFNWSAATFGRIKAATANARIAGLDVDRELEQIQAAVVTAHQTGLTARKVIPVAQQGVTAAEEALRLTQKNLETGTGLTLDVLVAQDTAFQARLNYATAIVRYNQAEVNLLAALGLIDALNVEVRSRGKRAQVAPH